MRERLVDLIEKSGMVETRSRCSIIADDLIAAGVCFAPAEIVIRKDITDNMLRQIQNAFTMPTMIMPYIPEQESVEIVPQWIPVTERFPEENGIYLTFNKKKQYEFHMFQTGKRMWKGIWQEDGVTHWMPLPEPPKEAQG